MRRQLSVIVALFTLSLAPLIRSGAQAKESLRPIGAIPMPNVKGRIDHMDVDVEGKRLFVAGLENGSVEVLDLRAGKWVRSLPGFEKPQGILSQTRPFLCWRSRQKEASLRKSGHSKPKISQL